MDFWRSIAGMVEVELTSAEPGSALSSINTQGIEIYELQQISDLTSHFRIRHSDYRNLAALCEQRGETLHVLGQTGLYRTGKRLLGRPVLLLGITLLFLLALWLPTRIFFVRVEGNVTVPARKILAAAEEGGICFGASRREVRSEKMKNALLAAMPELQWAGINTSGCVATISVRERMPEKKSEDKAGISSIVAGNDGYIISATVTQGNALCRIGQTVKEGQMLVSGYTDCGIYIQATRAEGEIFAQTNRNLTVITPAEYRLRGESTDVKRKYSLLLGKKRINLWKDSGIWDTSCGRMYEEYYITLPGGFQLPIAVCVEKYTFYELETAEIPQTIAEEKLKEFSDGYLVQQMVAGNILTKTQSVIYEGGLYRLEGTFVCVEMIGRVQQERIGETNGKSG